MKWIIVLSALVVIAAAEEKYSAENDDLDIDGLVKDDEQRTAFLKCFNDEGPCDERSINFKILLLCPVLWKDVIPIADEKKHYHFIEDIQEAVIEACAKCTEAQKHIFKVFLDAIKVKDPEGYKTFQKKYDPQNKYLAALVSAIAKF